MVTLEECRQKICQIISEYAAIPYAHGEIARQTIFDSESDRYLLMIVGREGKKYVHGCIIHVDIIDNKIWIHRDGTEYEIANELVDLGIPKQQIVLGFHAPEARKYTEFAVG